MKNQLLRNTEWLLDKMTFNWAGTNVSAFCPGLVEISTLEINLTDFTTTTVTPQTTESIEPALTEVRDYLNYLLSKIVKKNHGKIIFFRFFSKFSDSR